MGVALRTGMIPSPLCQRGEGQGEGIVGRWLRRPPFSHPLILTFSPASGGEGTELRPDPRQP